MKKSMVIISLISILLCPATFAYIAGKELKAEIPIYCPSSIMCQSGTANSCKPKGGDPQYWGNFTGHFSKPADIPLTSVAAPYHTDSPLVVQCIYEIPSYAKITLSSKSEANLEAYYHKGTSWAINSGKADCVSAFSSQCPLRGQSSVVLHSIDIPGGVNVAINGVRITSVPSSGFARVTFDMALVGCSSVKICKMEIQSLRGVIYGSFTVDMDNKLEVKEVVSNYPKYISITKAAHFNVVEVKYDDIENA